MGIQNSDMLFYIDLVFSLNVFEMTATMTHVMVVPPAVQISKLLRQRLVCLSLSLQVEHSSFSANT
jgi:hypothetical protein